MNTPKERLQRALTAVKKNRTRLTNKAAYVKEENVKTSLILPLLVGLGYDVFDTDYLEPEYNIRGTTKKVDYLIFHKKLNAYMIEAKSLGVNLDRFVEQLNDYFNQVSVPIGILTNGIEYRIYLADEQGAMNQYPSYVFDVLDYEDKDLDILLTLSREQFSLNTTVEALTREGYVTRFKQFLTIDNLLNQQQVLDTIIQAEFKLPMNRVVLDFFTPMLQEALESVLDEENQLYVSKPVIPRKPVDLTINETEKETVEHLKQILKRRYTDEELETLEITKTSSYVNVYLPGTKYWVIRIFTRNTVHCFMLHDNKFGRSDRGTKISFKRPQEIGYHASDILAIVDTYNTEQGA